MSDGFSHDARSKSFGNIAAHYDRYRPGPPEEAVGWLLPSPVDRVLDLGAGTGALSRILVGYADDVVAVEPDDRMRAVLTESVPGVSALEGRGEALPIPDSSVDAVLASSSWHWMDPAATLAEVARVLRPGGFLAALWSGPDPEGPFSTQARALLASRPAGPRRRGGVMPGGAPVSHRLVIPDGVGFEEPQHEAFRWIMPLGADDLVGLLGTLSSVILMEDTEREQLLGSARRLLAEALGVEGAVTVDVDFLCEVYRTRPL